ncbi:MAG: hypothetical protein GY937_13545 [bacterium]|nr:hypothetical protein [bacterium]
MENESPAFAIAASMPEPWFNKGQALLLAAQAVEVELHEFWLRFDAAETTSKCVLWLRPNVHTSYFMLVAFALENLLKGLIVRSDRRRARQMTWKGKLGKLVGTHELVRLAGQANVALEGAEEDLLHRLTAAGVWVGRYPVPLKGDDLLAGQVFPDGQVKDNRLERSDIEASKRFVARVLGLIASG